MSDAFAHLPYRPCVGVMLVNAAGKVWVGRRIDRTDEAWQMPQGGVDPGEAPEDTALRELGEETGIAPHLVTLVARAPREYVYDLPPELMGRLWGGKWRGQRQTWFLARFAGSDADIDIRTAHPEFDAWQWVDPAALPGLIVWFKRPLYEALVAELAPLIA